MTNVKITTIDDVIETLDRIIDECEQESSALGYFAALYQKVTVKVKEGITTNYFDDGPRMEKLDVIFAQKYIVAYYEWKAGNEISKSWETAFRFAHKKWPVVLQHLLMGMNAHINLDLGIAAAEVSPGAKINDLRNDFFRINEILASLVNDVQNNLSTIWPPLKKILQKSGKLDNLITDFSMELARDGAWKFAKQLAAIPIKDLPGEITLRDEKVAQKAELVSNPGFGIKLLLFVIRLGETGNVAEKIQKLKGKI